MYNNIEKCVRSYIEAQKENMPIFKNEHDVYHILYDGSCVLIFVLLKIQVQLNSKVWIKSIDSGC